jgi:rhodanese-related sulfurtransferase
VHVSPNQPSTTDPGRAEGSAPEVTQISVEDLAALHATQPAVIDVRNPDEYRAAHVPGATLIPLGELGARVGEVPTDTPVYLICAVGGRSQRACEFLVRTGRTAINIRGGTRAWIEAGYPVATGPES